MASTAERQRAFRDRLREAGQVSVTGIVNDRQWAMAQEVLKRLRENPELEVSTLRNTRTGRFERL